MITITFITYIISTFCHQWRSMTSKVLQTVIMQWSWGWKNTSLRNSIILRKVKCSAQLYWFCIYSQTIKNALKNVNTIQFILHHVTKEMWTGILDKCLNYHWHPTLLYYTIPTKLWIRYFRTFSMCNTRKTLWMILYTYWRE